jgi:crotonobetainyl-CoA:carnitine CoA-transferase CaiB-like acyl-CoA transferase
VVGTGPAAPASEPPAAAEGGLPPAARSPSSQRPFLPGPLAHLRVVELTDLRGALAGRMLADLGADVVKVEPPGGDPDRLCPPFVGEVASKDRSIPFLFRNANKRAVTLDLHSKAGWRRFIELCQGADILIENLAPDDELRHQIMSDEVKARLPELIHVAMADFGLSGPRASWRLEPLVAFAASGALWASGFPDRPPCWLPGYIAHDCASVAAVIGALAALGTRSGGGERVEVSVQEAARSALDPWAIALPDYARVYPVLPSLLPRNGEGPALVLPTADGYVRVLPIAPRHWRAFLALLADRKVSPGKGAAKPASQGGVRSRRGLLAGGLTAMAHEAAHTARRAVGAAAHLPLPGSFLPVFQRILATLRFVGREALVRRSREEVLAKGHSLGLPIVPVNTPEEFVSEEQTRLRGYFRSTGFPQLGKAPFAPFPCQLSRTPVTLRRPAPAPGESDDPGFAPREPIGTAARNDGPPLAGLRVVSFGVGAAVPGLCRTFSELGCEVIKIESRASLDFLRRLSLEPEAMNRSWPFNDENRGHKSVCLNLRKARARELALDLCARADIVVENHQGGALDRFGLDYESIRRVRSDVVYLSSQGFGKGGPLGEAPSFGPLNAAFSGVAFLWNHPDAPYPAGSALEHPDHIASQLAALAALAALEHRRRTGEGQRIEMSQSEAAAFLLGEFYLEAPLTGRRTAPRGNSAEFACPHGVYPAAGQDRWVAIAVVGDDAWKRFQKLLGWRSDPALAKLPGRIAARASIDRRIAAWSRRRNAAKIAEVLQAVGISAMPVETAEDQRDDPHLAERGAFVTLEDPEIGPVRHVANPIRLARARLETAAPAPCLGADTEAVLTGVLGLKRSAVRRLIATGVCA